MVAHTCNRSTREVEAERQEFKTSISYLVSSRPALSKRKQKETQTITTMKPQTFLFDTDVVAFAYNPSIEEVGGRRNRKEFKVLLS